MTSSEIVHAVAERFGEAVLATHPRGLYLRVHVVAGSWRPLAEWLRRDPTLDFDWFACLTSLDYPVEDRLAAAYDLYSTTRRHWLGVKVFVDRADPRLPSVMDLWPAADWHEREAFDLMGLVFEGHGDLRRILLADDWVGHPLRKDYVFPREYQGIPATYE